MFACVVVCCAAKATGKSKNKKPIIVFLSNDEKWYAVQVSDTTMMSFAEKDGYKKIDL
jgi:hypothetical protein